MSARVRRLALGSFSLALLLGLAGTGTACVLATPRWTGARSAHFDGTRFFTPGRPTLTHSPGDFWRWQRERRRGPWRSFHAEPPGPPPPREVGPGRLRVTFINHATTLIQLDGVNVLTDPIYSERASPFRFVGPRRVRPPGIRFVDLPRIDAVVLSHNHYDHLDLPTLRRIADTWPAVRVFAPLGHKALLERAGIPHVTELDWWEARSLGGVTFRCLPAQHFSNRSVFDQDAALWSAWSIEGLGGRAYFAGDTGYGPHFAAARERLGPFRLAVLPIGAFRPEWLMGPIHLSPAQAIQAAKDLGAALAVPMHYGTFPLADDGETEPPEVLAALLRETPAPFAVLGFGEGIDAPEVGR